MLEYGVNAFIGTPNGSECVQTPLPEGTDCDTPLDHPFFAMVTAIVCPKGVLRRQRALVASVIERSVS